MKLSQRRFLVALTATAVVTAGLPAVAVADPEPTTGVELVVGQDKFAGQKVSYDPAAGTNEGAAALRDLRGYMWDQNPPFRGYGFEGYTGTLQDAARREGITTKQQFQDISIDEDLNWIGIQRAVEASVSFQHKRPDGREIKTATRGKQTDEMESLSGGRANLRDAIINGWGKNELPALRATGGEWTNENGHLVHLIHPRHKVFGFGDVTVPGTTYTTYQAAISASSLRTPVSTQDGRRTQIIHHAATTKERPTGIISQQTTQQPPANQPQDQPQTGNQPGITAPATVTGSSGGAIGTVIGIVALIITLLGGIGFAINFQF